MYHSELTLKCTTDAALFYAVTEAVHLSNLCGSKVHSFLSPIPLLFMLTMDARF